MKTRVMIVSHAKAASRRRSMIKLTGNWLDEIGFTAGKLVTAEYGKGKILLRLQDSDNYKDLVRGALRTSSGLFQVRLEKNNKKQFSQIDIKGFWLEELGFTIGSMIAVRYEYGFIKILLVDLEKLDE
ncbi:MAG: type I toxin-antitoxin system SymE family toxin [Firmicutes bacterium]|nr:type I toxin-antitoxin system SymE family toxin [Bacillota bacterium]